MSARNRHATNQQTDGEPTAQRGNSNLRTSITILTGFIIPGKEEEFQEYLMQALREVEKRVTHISSCKDTATACYTEPKPAAIPKDLIVKVVKETLTQLKEATGLKNT